MVINNYKTFEEIENHLQITSFVVGIPSGEVIDTPYEIYKKLRSHQLIKYNAKIDAFTYSDHNYAKVCKIAMDDKKVQQIEFQLAVLGITKYEIIHNYTVDVFENVDISQRNLPRIPVKFRRIVGDFDCSYNKLNNLTNSPEEVTGLFDCSLNGLYSIVGGPKIVRNGYYCSDNNLTDLEGFPLEVYKVFDAERNNLKTLKGTPEILLCKDFDVSQNKLVNLYDGPKKGFNFNCSHNQIVTLENGVLELKGIFDCTYNKLKTLKGKPKCGILRYNVGNKVNDNE